MNLLWPWLMQGYTEDMNPRKYAKYEKRILDAIQKLEDTGYFKNEMDKTFLVVNSFAMIPVESTIGFPVQGNTIPMVAVISAETGRVYHFALKTLVPDIYQEIFGDG